MNKKDRKSLRKSINECLRSLHLPVEKPDLNALMKDPNIVVFSQICNDHVCGSVVIKCDEDTRVLSLVVANRDKYPANRLDDVRVFLDLIHRVTGLYNFYLCPCCNGVHLHADLYVPEKRFPAGKLKTLLKTILEEIYIILPHIEKLVNRGGDPAEIYGQCSERMEEDVGGTDVAPSSAHLDEIRTIIKEMGIRTLDEEEPVEDQIGMGFHLDNGEIYVITVTSIGDRIMLEAWPRLEFGADKLVTMRELINRLNHGRLIASYFHVFEKDDRFRLRRVKVIMLENDQLDKDEFQSVVGRWIDSANVVFPLLWTRLVSDQDPDVLIEQRLQEMRERSTEMSPPSH